MKVKDLRCLICKTFELKDHPEKNNYKDTIFNYMLKCGHCGYSVDRQTHAEMLTKLLKKSEK